MANIPKDPRQDIYRLLDRAGLNGTTFLTSKKPMARIVADMRSQLVGELHTYITTRDKAMINKGLAQSETRKIEVRDEDDL